MGNWTWERIPSWPVLKHRKHTKHLPCLLWRYKNSSDIWIQIPYIFVNISSHFVVVAVCYFLLTIKVLSGTVYLLVVASAFSVLSKKTIT